MEDLREQLLTERRIQRFEDVAARRLQCLTVVLEGIIDQHNVSACLRSAESFGVPTVYVIAPKRPKKTEGISRYANRWLEVRHRQRPDRVAAELRESGFALVGTVADHEGLPFSELELPAKTALVMGNEHLGLSAEMQALCDVLITIPTSGFTQSLNLSVATAILLQHFQARYRRRDGDVYLSPERQKALVDKWCKREIKAKLRRKD
jgi:tRNA (guanosine-2'-O-)-methyltransferase